MRRGWGSRQCQSASRPTAPPAAAVTEAMQLYLCYGGDIGSGTDNHAVNVGVRFSW